MRSFSFLLFFVKRLTNGTVTKDTAIAATPISGEWEAATLKLDVKVITRVVPATVRNPAMIPAKAPIFVIFLENKPQMYGPIKQPETIPQEKDIKLTMMGMFCVAKIKEQAIKVRQRTLVKSI